MKSPKDPLIQRPAADRLHYATGELLGAADFQDEQTYHRRRLAQALLHMGGSGTLAGLRAIVVHHPGQNGAPDDVELEIQPGLALDRAGRLIEVPREACLRLRRWFEYLAHRRPDSEGVDVSDLRGAWRADAGLPAGGAVVADVFLAFHACERGYTPAFASGPFDALDATQASRVRDGYELTLVLRSEADANLPTPFDPWAGLTTANLSQRVLGAWSALALPEPGHVGPWHENPEGTDPTAVLLARLRIPAAPAPDAASAPVPDWSAGTWSSPSANLNNDLRNFLVPPAAVSRLAGF